jgi:hypothetical protein
MITLIYASSAVQLMSQEELITLLTKAREKNKSLNITGMLLYKDGNFLQILEGPEAEVTALFDTIKRDPRHRGVIRIMKRAIEARQFSEWEMGFTQIDPAMAEKLPGYSAFLTDSFDPEHFQKNPSVAYRFLLTFKEIIR